jgi:hypothetical protein
VRIGLGSGEIRLECKKPLKARFAGRGQSAEDVCPANTCGGTKQKRVGGPDSENSR